MRKIKSVKEPCGKGVEFQPGNSMWHRVLFGSRGDCFSGSLCEPGPLHAGVMRVGRQLLVEN